MVKPGSSKSLLDLQSRIAIGQLADNLQVICDEIENSTQKAGAQQYIESLRKLAGNLCTSR